MKMYIILTVSMPVSWLCYCTIVLQAVTIEGNLSKITQGLLYHFLWFRGNPYFDIPRYLMKSTLKIMQFLVFKLFEREKETNIESCNLEVLSFSAFKSWGRNLEPGIQPHVSGRSLIITPSLLHPRVCVSRSWNQEPEIYTSY